MHGRSGTRNIKQVSVGYEEIPNRERCRLALLLFYVESRRKRKDVLNTDIKTRRQWNILGADFAECVCVCVCVCVCKSEVHLYSFNFYDRSHGCNVDYGMLGVITRFSLSTCSPTVMNVL